MILNSLFSQILFFVNLVISHVQLHGGYFVELLFRVCHNCALRSFLKLRNSCLSHKMLV